MTELSSKSLAQLVNDNHKAASVFESYELDFCCNGKRSLQQACLEKSLPVEQLLAELQAITNNDEIPVDYSKMSLTRLADHIVFTHHEYVKREMPRVLAYLQRVAFKHGDRHPEMNKVFELYSTVKQEMEEHMRKEEMILFPRIKTVEKQAAEKTEINMNIAYLQSPVHVMETEHDQAGQLMNEIRQLTANYTPPPDACTTYRLSFAALQAFELDLHQHVHLENNILFPKAIELFKQISTETLN